MATDEEREIAREFFGDDLSEKELSNFLEATVASNPVGVRISLRRYCRRSTSIPLLSGFFIFLLLLTWGLSFWTWWVAFLPALLALLCLLIFFQILRKAKEQYHDGLLVPGMVTSVSPPQILVLANMSRGGHTEEDSYETHFALKLISAGSLDPHPLQVGTIISCAAVFNEGENADYWNDVIPEPVCWGTKNRSVLNECHSRLDDEDLENLNTLFENNTFPKDANGVAVLVQDLLAKPSGPPPLPS